MAKKEDWKQPYPALSLSLSLSQLCSRIIVTTKDDDVEK